MTPRDKKIPDIFMQTVLMSLEAALKEADDVAAVHLACAQKLKQNAEAMIEIDTMIAKAKERMDGDR